MRTKHLLINMQKNKITKSLQVPCSPLSIISKSYLPGKRVLPFTSQNRVKASLTVEAAVVLPLFFFFSMAVLSPMQWLDRQRRVQTVTDQFAENLSLYAYGKEEDSEWSGVFSDAAAGVWLVGALNDLANDVRIVTSEVPDESGDICFELQYQEKVPFFSKAVSPITMRCAVKRRSWIGLSGKLKRSNSREQGNQDNTLTMVYVGETMTRYHTYRDCQYLSNQFKTVTVQEAKNLRNDDGKRYRACDSCFTSEYEQMAAENTQYTVYITEGGRHYHSTPDCTTMIAYLRKVPLDEVAYLGECSACKRRNGGS